MLTDVPILHVILSHLIFWMLFCMQKIVCSVLL